MPWSVGNSSFYESVIQAIAERYEIDLDTPWQELSEEQQDLFLYGTEGERDLRPVPQPDGPQALVHARVRGHRREPRAALPRDRLARSSASGSRSTCRSGRARSASGARLKPEVLAVTVGERNIHEFTQMSVTRVARVPRRARADRDRAADRRADREGDPRAADVPRRRRRRLPHARPRGARRSPAARRSGSGSRRRSARSSSACSTSSTSRRSACTSATTAG